MKKKKKINKYGKYKTNRKFIRKSFPRANFLGIRHYTSLHDVVGVREKSKSMIIISSSLSSENAVHEWLGFSSTIAQYSFLTSLSLGDMNIEISLTHIKKNTIVFFKQLLNH
ncbi:hypothetical protein N9K77_00755 [bacterium]|nr:hypothetical protein [bacterium]MDA8556718.1 hypothetical protein [bacterium]